MPRLHMRLASYDTIRGGRAQRRSALLTWCLRRGQWRTGQ